MHLLQILMCQMQPKNSSKGFLWRTSYLRW